MSGTIWPKEPLFFFFDKEKEWGRTSSIAIPSGHDYESPHSAGKYSIQGDSSTLPHHIGWIRHPSPTKVSEGSIPKRNIAIPRPGPKTNPRFIRVNHSIISRTWYMWMQNQSPFHLNYHLGGKWTTSGLKSSWDRMTEGNTNRNIGSCVIYRFFKHVLNVP